MKQGVILALALMLLAIFACPIPLFAAEGHVRFEVVGHTSCTKDVASGATALDIGGPCPADNPILTVSQGATLDVDGTSDFSLDAWRMPHSISITANQALDNVHIVFLREARVAPITPYQVVYYKAWVKGGISNGSGSLKVIGSVKQVSDGVTLTLDPVQVSAANGGTFEGSSVKQWRASQIGSELQQNRELQLDVEIVHLDNGATMDLSLGGGGWIKLRNQPSADNPNPPVVCKGGWKQNWFFTTTCGTTHSLGYPGNVVFQQRATPVAQAHHFAKAEWESLAQDIARGKGEHLSSLAFLLEIPERRQAAFFALAQGEFAFLSQEREVTPDLMIAVLQGHMGEFQ